MAGILQLPCLGRPFHLGVLYDSRSEKLIPGITLWNAETLNSALQSRPQPSSKFEIIAEDSIKKKSTGLGISASLKLSFLGELVKVSGSAEYMDDRKSSKQQARVSIKYSSTTHFEELTMEQISGIQHPDVFSDKDATHVVTGVLYGSDAFFVFDRLVSSSEKMRDVHGKMEVLVGAIPRIADVSGSGYLKVKENEKEEAEKFRCTFYGDLILPCNPSSYSEAIKVYGELPALLEGKSVPKIVYLYPLSKLDGRQQQIIRTISSGLISKVEETMESIHEIEIQCKDLKMYDESSKFSDTGDQISLFLALLNRFKADFVKKLSELLPKIRGTSAEETQLADIISSIQKSPFNSKELTGYVKRKSKELSLLGQYLKNMSKEPKIQYIFSSEVSGLFSLTTDSQFEHVICFSFNVTSEETAFTQKLDNYLTTGETSSACEKEWFEKQEILKDLRNKNKRFLEFIKTNAEKEDLAFAVIDKNEEANSSGPSIILYSNGDPIDFEPPGKPGTPQHEKIYEDSIDLVWSAPDEGAASILSYNIFYGPSGTSVSYSKTSTTEEKIHIGNLTSSTEYCFKVQGVCVAGVSMESSIYRIVTCPPSITRPADDFLKKSKLIAEGPPSIYELPFKTTMKDTNSKLAKINIGCKSRTIRKQERVLMLVGETGAGKSTLINGLANYVLGVEWEDAFRFKVISENVHISQACSQTKYITAYTFHSTNLQYALTVIDTPGFGDTDGGIANDKKLERQIKTFFSNTGSNGIDQLHGIGFVTQASQARLTANQKYIFQAILSIFGKDVADNIYLMTTFSDSKRPPVLEAVKEAKIPYQEHFKFNNSAIYDCNNTTSNAEFDSMFWKMGVQSFMQFFQFFSKASPKSLMMTREVLKEREQLEVLIPSLQRQIQAGLSRLDEIQQEEKILQQYEAQIDENKKFIFDIKISKQRKRFQKGACTSNCLKCSFTCHDTCKIVRDEEKHRCCMMKDGYCTACPDKCQWEKHSNTPYYYEDYYVTEKRTSEDLKMRYDSAKSGKTLSQCMIANNKAILNKLKAEVYSNIRQVTKCVNRLSEIALKPNPLSNIDYINLLIESEKKEHKTGWQGRVREYQNIREYAILLKKLPDISEHVEDNSWLSNFRS